MADDFTIEVDADNLDKVASQLDHILDLGIDTWAEHVAQAIKAESPTDTGGMRGSVYRETPITQERADAVGTFLSLNAKGHEGVAPEVGEHEGVVGVSAAYGQAVNNGHHTPGGGWVPANPFFDRAAQAASDEGAQLALVKMKNLVNLAAGGATIGDKE